MSLPYHYTTPLQGQYFQISRFVVRKNKDSKICLNYVEDETVFEKLEELPATCQELAAPLIRNDHAFMIGKLTNFENFEFYCICQGCDRRVDKNQTSCQQKSCRFKGEPFHLMPQVSFGFNILMHEEKTSPYVKQRENLKINTNTDNFIDGHLSQVFKVETITQLRQWVMRDCEASMKSPQAKQYIRMARQMVQFWLQMVMKYCTKSPVKLQYSKKSYGKTSGEGQKYVNKIFIDYTGFPTSLRLFSPAEQEELEQTLSALRMLGQESVGAAAAATVI